MERQGIGREGRSIIGEGRGKGEEGKNRRRRRPKRRKGEGEKEKGKRKIKRDPKFITRNKGLVVFDNRTGRGKL